jgi:hypothetical protein
MEMGVNSSCSVEEIGASLSRYDNDHLCVIAQQIRGDTPWRIAVLDNPFL